MINPAPIGSQSSLNGGDHEELKILLKNFLIPSRFNQELSYKGRIHRFLKGNFRENFRLSDPVGGGFDGHDRTMIVGHQLEAIVAMIVQRLDHDRAAIGRRSRNDRVTISLLSLPPSDEDRVAASRSLV